MLALEYRQIQSRDGHEAGRALLRQMVQSLTGQPMPPIATGPRGKPCFAGSDLHFSISHTKAHVFCALSDKPIGIDAEELDRAISLTLVGKVLSDGERAQYEACEDKRLALLTFWVLKEAAAKCTGKGLAGYPNHTNFSLDDPRVITMDGCLLAVIEEEDHAL